jgi:arylsulfatase A-like enzyme
VDILLKMRLSGVVEQGDLMHTGRINMGYTRRDFLKAAGIGAASLTLGESAGQTSASNDSSRPNIIFIMADDLGYGDLECYGQKKIKTPNIDMLAKEGTRFTDCHAGSSVCAPSRAVLMTGLNTGHAQVRANWPREGGLRTNPGGTQEPGAPRIGLRKGDTTIAQVLKSAGYKTGIIGKWHLDGYLASGNPVRHGFDEFRGFLHMDMRTDTPRYYPEMQFHNEKLVYLEGNRNGNRGTYKDDNYLRQSLYSIEANYKRPFFLYLNFKIPHAPFVVPSLEPYASKPWKPEEKAYAAMITRMDGYIGMIVRSLRELGIEKNTIVFFCSDNGNYERWEGLFDSCGPLRGRKGNLYEGGIRVPMIVKWPGKIPAGSVSDQVWCFADVLPTFAQIAGVTAPSNIDGVSVLPTLLGKKQDLSDRFLYWEYFHYQNGFQLAVRWRNWKAVLNKPYKSLQLYNLTQDISEKHDVADQNPGVLNKIKAYLRTARTDSTCWPLSQKRNRHCCSYKGVTTIYLFGLSILLERLNGKCQLN